MSLLPLILYACWTNVCSSYRLTDQNFGLGLYSDQLIFSSALDGLYKPSHNADLELYLREVLRQRERGASAIEEKDLFKVTIDLKQFRPEDIEVKLVGRYIVVKAEHEVREVKHEQHTTWTSSYLLPENANAEKITSTISNGILLITAPLTPNLEKPQEKKIKTLIKDVPDTTVRLETTTTDITADKKDEESKAKPIEESSKPEK